MGLRLQFNRCILSICDNRKNRKLHSSLYLVSVNDIYKITLKIKQRSNNTIVKNCRTAVVLECNQERKQYKDKNWQNVCNDIFEAMFGNGYLTNFMVCN